MKYILPNIATALNLLAGLTAIGFIAQDYSRDPLLTVSLPVLWPAWLVVAVLFDLLDGMLARRLRATSRFGVVFDSVADAVSFGLAPSFAIWSLQAWGAPTMMKALATGWLMMSLLRLVRYTREALSVASGEDSVEVLDVYRGLPSPLATCLWIVICAFFVLSPPFEMAQSTSQWGFAGLTLLTMVLMVSPFTVKKPLF